MITITNFKKNQGTSKGKNGISNTIGVESMSTNGGKHLMLSPVGKSGAALASCWIEVPTEDVENIILDMLKTTGINPVDFAKKILG